MKVLHKATRGGFDFVYLERSRCYALHRNNGESQEWIRWLGGNDINWSDSTDNPKLGEDEDYISKGEMDEDANAVLILKRFANRFNLSICRKCCGIGSCSCQEIKDEEDRRRTDNARMRSIMACGSEGAEYYKKEEPVKKIPTKQVTLETIGGIDQ